MDSEAAIKKVAMIGCGSMGTGMALLLAEHGIEVALNDPSEDAIKTLLDAAKKDGLDDRLTHPRDYKELCECLDRPRVIFYSLPHGPVGDTVSEGLRSYLDPGDIIIDGGNEHWETSQRRLGRLAAQGIHYIGCGVSGGYQSARRGPSLCPGGLDVAIKQAMPLLKKIAAKDGRGRPCVGHIGQGGAGHFVKMIHNGIEHAMMSALAEAWAIMRSALDMSLDEIGDVMKQWNSKGLLKNSFLVDVGAEVCQKRDKDNSHVLSKVKDKVVQDVEGSEGTGTWSQYEAIRLHAAAPTLTAAHYMRVTSAYRSTREELHKAFDGGFPVQKIAFNSKAEKDAFIEDLRQAVYVTFLASFVQGINIISQADRENKWKIDFLAVAQIWRAGCIITSDHIIDLLETNFSKPTKAPPTTNRYNLLFDDQVRQELKQGFPALKRAVLKAMEVDAAIPSLSATLEYLKHTTSVALPTSFTEAEMDYFGNHKFDLVDEEAGDPVTGKHHFEWKPA